tara:strand:+ start:1372 stop:3390 length:2019 start_codon:yes stop_codon:yes gene_type:complete
MAEKRTINLDVNTNAEQVGNQFDNLNKSIDGTTKSNKDLHATFEEVYDDIRPLTAQMGEMEDRLYQMALAGEQTTDEFKELLKEVGKYRKTQIETDLAVDTAAQTMSAKLGGALQGAASGFAVVQGAMGLFGTESEEVEQALLKVNSAMALADGIKGIQDFSKSFNLASKSTKAFTLVQKGLNLVLKANPFALIVTAVIGLIGYFAVFTDAINVVIEGLKSVSDFLGITDYEAEENAKKREAEAETQRRLQEAEQKRAERLHNSKMNDLDNEIALARAQGKDTTKLQKKKINELIKIKKAKLSELAVDEALLENIKQRLIATAGMGGVAEAVAKASLKALESREEESAKLKDEISKLETDLKIVDIEFNKRSRERSKNYKAEKDAKEKADKEAADKELQRQNAIEKKRKDNLKKLRDDFETSLEAETEIANKRLISEQEFEIQLVQDKYFNLIEQAKQYGLDTQVLEENQQAAIKEIEDKYRKEKEEAEDEAKKKAKADRDKDIEDNARKWELRFQLANDSLGAISDLVTAFAGEGEEAQKKAFRVNKAISIAQAVISTAQGIMSQLAVPQDALTGANFVKAGIVAATGIAQISKISATKFQSSSAGGGGGINSPSDPGANATPTAQFNVVGDSGVNQLAQLQMQPTQAFVVSGDITTAQSLDRNKIENATL